MELREDSPISGMQTATSFWRTCLDFALGNSERPLIPGYVRVKWTCVCGAKLYDDFEDSASAAAEQVQRSIKEIYGRCELIGASVRSPAYPAGASPQHSVSSNPAIGSSTSGQSSDSFGQIVSQPSRGEGANVGTVKNNGRLPQSPSDVNHKSDDTRATWMYACFDFPYSVMQHMVHEVLPETNDYDLFTASRKFYFDKRFTLTWLLDLEEIDNIEYIKFFFIDQSRVSTLNSKQWPEEDDPVGGWSAQGWSYRKSRVPGVPPVSLSFLRHCWAYPHHVDRLAYDAWLKSSSLNRLSDWFWRQTSRDKAKFQPDPNHSPKIRSKWVVDASPKKLDPPDDTSYVVAGKCMRITAWGIHFKFKTRTCRIVCAFALPHIFAMILFSIKHHYTSAGLSTRPCLDMAYAFLLVFFLRLIFAVLRAWRGDPAVNRLNGLLFHLLFLFMALLLGVMEFFRQIPEDEIG